MKPMKCKFYGFVTAMGESIADVSKPVIPYGLRARIKRLEDHPRLGSPDGHDFTITSEVLCVDFQHKMIRTLNSIYYWE